MVRFPAETDLFHIVQTASGAYRAAKTTGIERTWRKYGHSAPSGAEVETCGVVFPLPPMPSWFTDDDFAFYFTYGQMSLSGAK